MAISVVSFSFSKCSTGGPGGPLCWLSLLHLITNWFGPQTPSGVPRAPSAGWWLSLPHLVSNSLYLNSSGPQLTDFLSSPSYIIVQSPIQSLEWHVWSSSSGNNCHAVHRSLSPVHQSMSVPWAFTLSHFLSQIRLRDFFRLLAIGMCHFLPVHHFGMACLAGSKVNIQHYMMLLVQQSMWVFIV